MRALITGASRGIGLELVRQHAEAGHDVIATCRNPGAADELKATAARHSAVVIKELDVTVQASIDRLAYDLRECSLDVLYNNAGDYGRSSGQLEDTDIDDWIRMFRVNTVGPLHVTRALIPALRRGAYPKVIALSSIKGSIGRNRLGGSYQYRATKAALNAIVRSLAIDLRPLGIAVYALSPGWVDRGEDFARDLDFRDRLIRARALVAEFGPGAARQTLQEAVARTISTVAQVGLEDTGAFLDHTGQPLPW